MVLNTSPSALVFQSSPMRIQIRDMPMNWRKETIVHRIAEKIGQVMEIDRYSLVSGTMRSVIARVLFKLESVLMLGDWIPFKGKQV